MAIATHHDEIGFASLGLGNQLGADTAVAALRTHEDGIDAMMLEMVEDIRAQRRLPFDRATISDDQHCDFLRLVQVGHCFGKRTRRFPAAIPRD